MERVRTLKGAVEHFRAQDPETVITEYALRRAIHEGKIPHAKSGHKFLVSLDAIERYFAGRTLEAQTSSPATERKYTLRRVH